VNVKLHAFGQPEKPALVAISKRSVSNDPEIEALAAEDCGSLGKCGLLAAMNMLWKLDLRNEDGSIGDRPKS
jgi:hypothetical protein